MRSAGCWKLILCRSHFPVVQELMSGGKSVGVDAVKVISVASMLVEGYENSWRLLELSGSAIKFLPMSIASSSDDSDFAFISIGLANRPPKKIVLS